MGETLIDDDVPPVAPATSDRDPEPRGAASHESVASGSKARARVADDSDDLLPPPSHRRSGRGGGLRRARQLPELERLGRYTVVGRLGEGGMGTVFEAIDHTLDRRVAIKVLRRAKERQTQRLIREAQAMARLSHPNVVQVYEAGEVDGRAFVVMELIEGRTVGEWMRQQPRPDWRSCVQVFIELGQGLAAAHAQGLVHRDFKPGNAIVDDEGRARVLDFGLAREAGVREASAREASAREASAREASSEPGSVFSADPSVESGRSALSTPMTRTGAMVGTPAYMSPEQMLGAQVDACSDQFSFCVTLWEVLYGQLPFEGDSMESQAMMLMEQRICAVPLDAAVPRSLHRLLLRGLAFRRAERWPSMDALLVQLRRLVAPRARLWWGAVAGGVGLVAVAAAWAYQSYVAHRSELARAAAQADRCTGARDQLVGVWDPSRQEEVREAIEGTGLSHAPQTRALVESVLDDYADRWARAHTAVCRATRVTQEQGEQEMSLRMGCLRQRKVALDELVKVLTRADAAIAGKAMTLAVGLPSLYRCDDVEALRAEQPPPEDPAEVDAVQAHRDRLAQARALEQAGAYERALDVSEAVMREAQSLGYGPLRAEARLARGRIHKSRGDNAEAEADLLEAYALGVEHGHPAVATDAAAALVFVVGYRQARYEAGLQWSLVALARARGPSSEPANEALALANTATVHKHRGELAPALDAYQRALAIFEELRGPEHLTVARSLGNIGGVLYMQHKPHEALRYFQRAWSILETSLGPHHPELAIWLSNMGSVLSEVGRHQEALEQLQRALAIQQQAPEPSASQAITLYNIGDAWENQGRGAEALAHYRRSLELFEQTLGPEHPQLAVPLRSIALRRREQGELGDAERDLRRALSIEQGAWGSEDPRAAGSLVALAKVVLERGDAVASRGYARQAISVLEAAGSAPTTLASARFVLARALWGEPAQRRQARAQAEQAADTWAHSGPDHEDSVATVQAWLAEHEP